MTESENCYAIKELVEAYTMLWNCQTNVTKDTMVIILAKIEKLAQA